MILCDQCLRANVEEMRPWVEMRVKLYIARSGGASKLDVLRAALSRLIDQERVTRWHCDPRKEVEAAFGRLRKRRAIRFDRESGQWKLTGEGRT